MKSIAKNITSILVISFFLILKTSFAETRSRAQYPRWLSDAYFGVNVGYINYPFGNQHLESGLFADRIAIPAPAVRIMLYGRDFSQYLSMQVTYMRPVWWVTYNEINGQANRRYVFMNVAGLTLRPSLPVSPRLTLTSEAGLAIVTRKGFEFDGIQGIADANYASVLLGAGVKYRVGQNWDLTFHGVYSPPNNSVKQPHTVFFSPGFQYNMRPLSNEVVARNSSTGYIFPKNQIKLGFSSNVLGYGVNDFLSQGVIPVFWGGKVHVERGLSLSYQRNIFHTKRVFSLDIGVSASLWETREGSTFQTLALYPFFRWTPIRTRTSDFYFFYSVAGPTFISRVIIDDFDTGEKFTFHDYMGIGSFFGRNRQFNTEIKIGHYSNGNLFPQNDAVKVPLTFAVGYTF